MQHLYMQDGSVNPKLTERTVIIWGCGNDGEKLYGKLRYLNAKVVAFCDSNKELQGKTIHDLPIISCEQLSEYRDANLALAFFKWREVLENIPGNYRNRVLADYLFENEGIGKCILCGNTKIRYDRAHFAPFLIERMFHGENKKTRMIHCPCCDLFYSDYRPNEEEIERLYSDYKGSEYLRQRQKYEPYYTLEYDKKTFRTKEYITLRKIREAEFLKSVVDFRDIHSVLDYGGDDGRFIPDEFEHASRYVYDISGCELQPGVRRVSSLEAVYENKWDFIMCCHLLEHVADPVNVVGKIVNAMERETFLYIELPYENIFKNYSDYEFNEHINFFAATCIEYFAKIFQLEVIKLSVHGNILQALLRKSIC